MNNFELMKDLLIRGKANDLVVEVNNGLENGLEPKDILENSLISGMSIVGDKFKNGEMYVPQVMIAARAMNKAIEILKPLLLKSGVEPIGTVVICTVAGDLHDIGKNICKIMLEGIGFNVIDLGTDVYKEAIIDAVKNNNVDIVCLSSLLSTTMIYDREIIQALEDNNLRDKVKVMVGGAPVTEEFSKEIGADAYTKDATTCAKVAKSFVS